MKSHLGTHARSLATLLAGASLSLSLPAQIEPLVQPVQRPPAGNYYSAQRPDLPPLPFSPFPEAKIYPVDERRFLYDDLDVDYEKVRSAAAAKAPSIETGQFMREPGAMMSGFLDDPTNLWLSVTAASNAVVAVLHNTVGDVLYEFYGRPSVAAGLWRLETVAIGAEGATEATIPLNGRPSLFLVAGSGDDSDGDGLSDAYEHFVSHTDPFSAETGTNGIPDGYADPDGDGWTNLEELQNGTDPYSFNTPRPPQNLRVEYEWGAGEVRLGWQPAGGQVLEYAIERFDLGMGTEVARVSATTNEFACQGSPYLSPLYGGIQYGIRAFYSGGLTVLSSLVDVFQPELGLEARLTRGPGGRWRVVCSALPSSATSLRLLWVWWDYFDDNGIAVTYEDIAVNNLIEGGHVIPDEAALAHLTDVLWVQAVSADGQIGRPAWAGVLAGDAPCFVDGREHLKQNLTFLLRAATTRSPRSVWSEVFDRQRWIPYEVPGNTNFVEAGYLHRALAAKWYMAQQEDYVFEFLARENLWPFAVNFRLHNQYYDPGYSGPPFFVWPTNLATIPAEPLLGASEHFWTLQAMTNLSEIGASLSAGVFSLTGGVRNIYGLEVQRALAAFDCIPGFPCPPPAVVEAGASLLLTSGVPGAVYGEAAAPVLETVDYYFAPVRADGVPLYWDSATPVAHQPFATPLDPMFAVTNQTPLIVAAVGQPMTIGGWARQRIINGDPTKFAYLGQYFDQAFKADASGQATTNQTGILSEYGEFTPTEPGLHLLVTQPDLEQGGIRGTCRVHVVKLQLDVNHDGVMDLSFGGPDNTSAERPFRFWVNNDCDWATYPGSPHFDPGADKKVEPGLPDYYWDCRQLSPRSVRDLEDYTRLWICGVPALTNAGYQVTMSWANVSAKPAINLLLAVETNGGTLYLTDTNIQSLSGVPWQQIDGYVSDFGRKYRVTTNNVLTLPINWFANAGRKQFLFEGAGNGSGELVLTITQNSTSLVARTSVWLDLIDVKEMFERVHIADVTDASPHSFLSTYKEDNLVVKAANEDKKLIVFVHGWRMGQWDYYTFSESMFKRLYWQGYRGRFVAIRWPTLSKDDFKLPLRDFTTYNRSELRAFKSARGVSDYLNHLKQRFPDYSLNVCAHSMGNIVMMESLRHDLSVGRTNVDNYVLMQAAVPAHCYDATLTNYSRFILAEQLVPTPDTYRGYPGAIQGIVRNQIVNFFNTNDYALVTGPIGNWEVNQVTFKPDVFLGYNTDGTDSYKNSVVLSDSREIMAFVSRPRSQAIGARPGVGGVIAIAGEVDLTGRFGFLDGSDEHSAQFNWSIQRLNGFYKELLTKMQTSTSP